MKFLSWFCEVNEFQNWSHWKLFERLNRPMHTPQEVFATSTSQFGSSKNAPFWMNYDFTIVTKEIRIKNLIFLEWWGSRPPFWGRRRRQIFFTWTDYSCYVTYLYILIICTQWSSSIITKSPKQQLKSKAVDSRTYQMIVILASSKVHLLIWKYVVYSRRHLWITR